MEARDFDHSDAREAAILIHLESEGVVLWREDHPWKADDIVERHVIGMVAGGDGPDLFMASAWTTWGDTMNVRIHLLAPVTEVCKRFLPGRGDENVLAARTLHTGPGYDLAVIEETAGIGEAKYIGRNANTASAVYGLRITPKDGGEKKFAIATVHNEGGDYRSKLPVVMTFGELSALADETFGVQVASTKP